MESIVSEHEKIKMKDSVPEGATIRLRYREAHEMCEAVLVHAGLDADAARIVTENLLLADLRGISTHGITRLKLYVSRIKNGIYNVTPTIRVLRESEGTLLIDGDNGLGAVVGSEAMKLTIQKAERHGVGLGFVQHSNHYGAASYFAMMAVPKGMIGFSCTNGPANMAPTGCATGMVGTNPLSVAIPRSGSFPLVLDIATSVVARGRIMNAAKNGEPIPVGWAIDQDGRPTTDAQAALLGAVLPFGGHKGSGMSIMIDILSGVLTGAAFGCHVGQTKQDQRTSDKKMCNIGHMFLAINISKLQPREEFDERIEQMVREIKSAPRTEGTDEVLLPGELEAKKEVKNRRDGIPVSYGVFSELKELCASAKIEDLLINCVS